MGKKSKNKDPMRGFEFSGFRGINLHKCKDCGYTIASTGPGDFVPQADEHRKNCKLKKK